MPVSSNPEVPKVKVWITTRTEPYTLTVTGGTLAKWDLERARNDWPAVEDALNLWSNFVAYVALKATKQIDPEMTFDECLGLIVSVIWLDPAKVDPTKAATVAA